MTCNFYQRFTQVILKSSLIKIDAPLNPVPFKRVMTSGKRRYNPAGYTEFKDELGYFALKAMAGREPLTGAIKLSAEFYKNRKGITTGQWGDVDNFLKAVMDSLTGICYKDDGQVIEIHAKKFFGKPHVSIEVEEV